MLECVLFFTPSLGLLFFSLLVLSISDMLFLFYLLMMSYINIFYFYYHSIGACLFSNEGQKGWIWIGREVGRY